MVPLHSILYRSPRGHALRSHLNSTRRLALAHILNVTTKVTPRSRPRAALERGSLDELRLEVKLNELMFSSETYAGASRAMAA